MAKKTFRGMKINGFLGKFISAVMRHWFKLTLLLAMALSGLAIQRSIYADPAFGLRFVDIQTTGVLDKDRIVQWSGLKPGANIFDVDLKVIERRLLRRPEIKIVRLTRKMPNRIGIFVGERRIFLQGKASQDSETFWTLDEEGYIIPPPAVLLNPDLPVVVLPELSKFSMKIGMQYRNEHFAQLKDLIRAIEKSSMLRFENISYIALMSQGDFEIYLKSGLKLYVKEDFETALRKLTHVKELLSADKNTVEYIDMRFNDLAVKRKNK